MDQLSASTPPITTPFRGGDEGGCSAKHPTPRVQARSTTQTDVEREKMSDIENILSEREQRYGSFKAVSETVQAVKDILASRVAERGVRWSPGATEAREMIAHKLGRVVNGDWRYIDTWKDIAGYALLVVAELEELERNIIEKGWRPIAEIRSVDKSRHLIGIDALTDDTYSMSYSSDAGSFLVQSIEATYYVTHFADVTDEVGEEK